MAKSDAAEEAAEKPGRANLTPLGKRTLAGFITRYGEEQGETKFQQALDRGTIDRDKMTKNPKDKASVAGGE